MRTDSTGDITLAQPMSGHAVDISANTQQAYINNNTDGALGQPSLPVFPWWYYVLNPSLSTSMGNGISGAGFSHHHCSHQNQNLTIDGDTYNVSQIKSRFKNMKDELANTQVRVLPLLADSAISLMFLI